MLGYTSYWLRQDLCLSHIWCSSQQKSPHRRLISVAEGEFWRVFNHQLNILAWKWYIFCSTHCPELITLPVQVRAWNAVLQWAKKRAGNCYCSNCSQLTMQMLYFTILVVVYSEVQSDPLQFESCSHGLVFWLCPVFWGTRKWTGHLLDSCSEPSKYTDCPKYVNSHCKGSEWSIVVMSVDSECLGFKFMRPLCCITLTSQWTPPCHGGLICKNCSNNNKTFLIKLV